MWRGRERGLFYRWRDALLSVAGIPDALHKGFYSLSNATDALEGRDWIVLLSFVVISLPDDHYLSSMLLQKAG